MEALKILSEISPLGLAALLAYVIFLLVKQRKGTEKVAAGQDQIANNHLSSLPEMAETLKRIEAGVDSMAKDIIYIRARVNGSGK